AALAATICGEKRKHRFGAKAPPTFDVDIGALRRCDLRRTAERENQQSIDRKIVPWGFRWVKVRGNLG
ncbi:MAG: hypothetical protein ACK4I8_11100, partial [Armatimonadota bacterium]